VPARSPRRRLGDFGETAAVGYLTRQGYTVLARQWRCRWGEIDIVAQQDEHLVFVEVRTRRGGAGGTGAPEESITPTKQARMVKLAYAYLADQGCDDAQAWRIDVIAIELDRRGSIARLNHIAHAVEQ
jgi:putative endonuclease